MKKLSNRHYFSVLLIRGAIVITFAIVLSNCQYDSIPILYGIRDNISSLSISHNSSSSTLIANGINTLDLSVNAYDLNKQAVGELSFFESKNVKIKVSNGELLSHPYEFKTTTPCQYTFSIDGLNKDYFIPGNETIHAIPPAEFEQITLPVIFHYITNEKLSEQEKTKLTEKLHNTLSDVNNMFANQYGSVDPNGANAFINFTPAITDPSGNQLLYEGLDVIEISSPSPAVADDEIDNIIWNGNFWTPKKYVNVWIILMDNNYSWAYFPDLQPSSQDFPISIYGTVYNRKHLDINWVLAHEFGHMLQLFHVFDENTTCADADECKDTWSYSRKYDDSTTPWAFVKKTNCDETFTSNNYMDYDPSRFNTFSYEQILRMRNVIDKCNFLPTPANLNGRITTHGYSSVNMKRMPEQNLRVY